MSSKAFAERLGRALESTKLSQVVNADFGDNQVKVLCRVLEGAEADWIKLVQRLLVATEQEQDQAYGWRIHICRIYFLKPTQKGKKLVFGWNIAVQSQDIGTSLDFVTRIIRSEPPPEAYERRPNEVEEIEMTGVTGPRNLPSPTGKGAYPIGSSKGGDFKVGRSSTGVTR